MWDGGRRRLRVQAKTPWLWSRISIPAHRFIDEESEGGTKTGAIPAWNEEVGGIEINAGIV